MPDSQAFPDFSSAAQAVLAFTHARLGFDLWMVTRTEGDDWIVLQAEDHGYGVTPGTVFRWADTVCSRMADGRGPHIAPHTAAVPAYAEAPIGRQVPIGAYIGVPLNRDDGSLFGTLCAIHPTPQPEHITAELPLIKLLAGLLSTVLKAELELARELRRAEHAQAEARIDALTGLYNRRGWDQQLAAEEQRCRRYGHPACVVVVDLDGLKRVNDNDGHAAGDALIGRAAQALRGAVRIHDVVARLGGDEFAVLGTECDRSGAQALARRLRAALTAHDVAASLGLAMRDPGRGLAQAQDEADHAMYADKHARRQGRGEG